jgi:hypothetical protein
VTADQPVYEPAVDAEGAAVWLDHAGWVAWLEPDVPVPAGWRRLYVEREPDGGEAL